MRKVGESGLVCYQKNKFIPNLCKNFVLRHTIKKYDSILPPSLNNVSYNSNKTFNSGCCWKNKLFLHVGKKNPTQHKICYRFQFLMQLDSWDRKRTWPKLAMSLFGHLFLNKHNPHSQSKPFFWDGVCHLDVQFVRSIHLYSSYYLQNRKRFVSGPSFTISSS